MEDEETWCSDVTSCSCAMLRFAKDPRTEAGLKEFIADAEERLEVLEKMRREWHDQG